jgi:hypothetical protein
VFARKFGGEISYQAPEAVGRLLRAIRGGRNQLALLFGCVHFGIINDWRCPLLPSPDAPAQSLDRESLFRAEKRASGSSTRARMNSLPSTS